MNFLVGKTPVHPGMRGLASPFYGQSPGYVNNIPSPSWQHFGN